MRHDDSKRINVLGRGASLTALRWRASAVSRQGRVFLHSLDGMVNVGAPSKRRSSRNRLNEVARGFSILEPATGARAVFWLHFLGQEPR